MSEGQKSNWYRHFYIVAGLITGLSILGGYALYNLDNKRITDPCYKIKVQKKRDKIKLKETDELKHRLMAFPSSNNIKHIKQFVTQEVNSIFIENNKN